MYGCIAVCDNCEKRQDSRLFPTDMSQYSYARIPLGWKMFDNGSGWKLFCSVECKEKFFE